MALQPITPHISDVDNFLTHCHRRRYSNRATIIYEGDSCDTLYYIISGSVSVILEDNDGKEVIVAYLNPDDFLGEMGLFEQTEDRSAWCRTRNQSEIAEISYANFNAYVHDHPEIVFTIGRQMATRLRNTTRKVGDLSFFDVTGRVARTLIDLAKEPDAMTHPLGMQIRITRQEIGRIVNCSREMAGRVLKNLEEQELVTVSGKTIVVLGAR
ncbi:cAMP-activated global transcriptional regulator CRP [Gammaproteobacteria bacterium]|nr:cAMP-activated global transcriptional regulator CRP [Gammaproteobacteria bacterium]MDC1423102.1 cAMP-activated global transcriptional regulator CRP [Gammaproteobacteria bacterium]MDC1511810.1 cAMP-activated global transcriptional regulator CRP [Gammaproteobacteria bacterium]